MKRLLAAAIFSFISISAWPQAVYNGPTHITIIPAGAPSSPSELIVTQGGGPTVCNVNSGTGCLTNTAILIWPAVTGATYYNVQRNGVALGSGTCSGNITALTCTDSTATNLNRVTTYGDETTWTYTIQACNTNGCSTTLTYGAHWLYHGQAYNSCANYSGGGFGQYEGTTPVASFTSGSNIMTVTTLGSWTIFAGSSVQDASGAVPSSTGNSAIGNPYILPYGTSGTTGTGGLGTYALSANATKNATGDVIESQPGQYSQNGMEACPGTAVTESGHTYSMLFNWPLSGAYVQQYTASPGSVSYDMNVGDTNYSRVDVNTPSFSHGLRYTIHSRPGANGSQTGDIYSSRLVQVFSTTGTSSYCTGMAINTWFTCLIPNSVLGIGTGSFTGYVQANWHGHLTNTSSSQPILANGTITSGSPTLVVTSTPSAQLIVGTYVTGANIPANTILTTVPTGGLTGTYTMSNNATATVGTPESLSFPATAILASTSDGSYTNIAVGDYMMVHNPSGWQCFSPTSTPSSATGSFTITTCPSGGAYANTSSVETTDAQVCASASITSPGPDNAGLIQGNGEPDATYFGGGIVGYNDSPGTNPDGTGTCTGTGNGHWGLFNGNGTTISSAGSSGSQLTWTSKRTSLYKPEFLQNGGSGYLTYYIDMIGWQH